MDQSTASTTAAVRQPISKITRAVCCAVLFACSAVLPLLVYFVSLGDSGFIVASAIAVTTLAVCVAFALSLCKKPLFLISAAVCTLALAFFSPWFSALFAALLCATVAGAALIADANSLQAYLPFAIAPVAAFGLSVCITRDPLSCVIVLFPALIALALAICFRKGLSIILSVGTAAGTLIVAGLLLTFVELLVGGMPFSVQGISDAVKSYHASVSSLFAESMQIMTETPELAEQLKLMLGGELTPDQLTAFSDSVATAVLGMLPGTAILLCWIFAFVSHRGFTALLVKGLDKKDYPIQLIAYEPSLPSAILLILCYVALVVSSMFPQGEIVVFIALNILLALLPMMTVYGILSMIANLKRAPVKWPSLLLYAASVLFLGVAVIPMIAFFGSFGVIAQAVARALEKRFKDFKGGQ